MAGVFGFESLTRKSWLFFGELWRGFSVFLWSPECTSVFAVSHLGLSFFDVHGFIRVDVFPVAVEYTSAIPANKAARRWCFGSALVMVKDVLLVLVLEHW